jgi:chemotaxis response regulator CheB
MVVEQGKSEKKPITLMNHAACKRVSPSADVLFKSASPGL